MADRVIYGVPHCHWRDFTIEHLRYSMGFYIACCRHMDQAGARYMKWT